MFKNKKIYKNSIEFRKNEGIKLSSSQDIYRKKLQEFEGMQVSQIKLIKDILYSDVLGKKRLVGRTLTLSVLIQRTIEEKQITEEYREEEVTSDVVYKFILFKNWQLYKNDELIYDNANFLKYKDPRKFTNQLLNAKLIQVEIDSSWKKATMTFDNNLIIVITPFYNTSKAKGTHLAYFFTIVKDPEPFIMHLNFANPDEIYYSNEIVQLKVSPKKRKNQFIV